MNADWNSTQEKVFLKWVNSILRNRSKELKKLTELTSDTTNLYILLLAIITKEQEWIQQQLQVSPCKELESRLNHIQAKRKTLIFKTKILPKNTMEVIANCAAVLEYLNDEIKLVGLESSDFVVHDKTTANVVSKNLMALIWALILRYQINCMEQSATVEKSEQRLLDWCNEKLRSNNLQVKDFASDWKNPKIIEIILLNVVQNSYSLSKQKKVQIEDEIRKISTFQDKTNPSYSTKQKLMQVAKKQLELEEIDAEEIDDKYATILFCSYIRNYQLKEQRISTNNNITELEKSVAESVTVPQQNEQVQSSVSESISSNFMIQNYEITSLPTAAQIKLGHELDWEISAAEISLLLFLFVILLLLEYVTSWSR